MTEIGVPPKLRHTRSAGQSVARRAPAPGRVHNKQVQTANYDGHYSRIHGAHQILTHSRVYKVSNNDKSLVHSVGRFNSTGGCDHRWMF
jgi:hypothetical protein